MATAPITVTVDGLPVTYCPDGAADGCFELRSRGYGIQYSAVTVWPSYRHRHLTSGRDTRYLTFDVDHLFQPEFYVYLTEIRAAIKETLQSLSDPDPIERTCRMCPNPCKPRTDTGTARMYCSRSCQEKFIAWSKLAKELTAAFQDKLHDEINSKIKPTSLPVRDGRPRRERAAMQCRVLLHV